MSKRIHITPDGPRACSVDHNNPNSIGCRYPGTSHFTDPVAAQRAFEEMQGGSFNNAKSLLGDGRSLDFDALSALVQVIHAYKSKHEEKRVSEAYSKRLEGLTPEQRNQVWKMRGSYRGDYWVAVEQGLSHDDAIAFTKTWRSTYMRDHADENYEEARSAAISKFSKD